MQRVESLDICTNITVEELKKQYYCVECKNGNSDFI